VIRRRALGAGTYLILCTPPTIHWLESQLATHLLIQMPLLAACGWWLAAPASRSDAGNGSGGPGTALALGAALYWMLPRSMDWALENPWVDLLKFVTLPLAVGLPLALSWVRLSLVARSFLLSNLPPMLAVLSWLYWSAPARLCNFYLVDDQQRTGQLLLATALVVSAGLIYRCLLGAQPRAHPAPAEAARHTQASLPLATETLRPPSATTAPQLEL